MCFILNKWFDMLWSLTHCLSAYSCGHFMFGHQLSGSVGDHWTPRAENHYMTRPIRTWMIRVQQRQPLLVTVDVFAASNIKGETADWVKESGEQQAGKSNLRLDGIFLACCRPNVCYQNHQDINKFNLEMWKYITLGLVSQVVNHS